MANLTKAQLKNELTELGLVEGTDFQKDDNNETLEKLLAKTQKKIAKEKKEAERIKEEDDAKNDEGDGADKPADDVDDDDDDDDDEGDDDEEILGPQPTKDKLNYDGKGPIDIIKGQRFIRTFHEDAHGEDFAKLAKQFVNKNTDPKTKKTKFKMVNTEKIKAVKVEYTELTKKGMEKKTVKFGESIEQKERALQMASEKCVHPVIA